MEKERIGFVGLGTMGIPMVQNLLRGGYQVTVWNRSSDKYAALQDSGLDAGVRVAVDLAELAASSTLICSCLGSDAALRDIVAKLAGFLLPDHGVVDLSTVSPHTAIEISQQLGAYQVEFADAPVTGGDVGARNGTLTIMVGATSSFFNRISPVLGALGKKIVHLGEVGNGQKLKSINQVAVAISIVAMSEAMVMAKSFGLDLRVVLDSLSSGAAGSWAMTNYAPRILNGDLRPGFSAEHMLKDLRIVEKLIRERDLELPGTQLATELYAELCARNATRAGELGNHALITGYPGWLDKVEMV